MLIRNRPGVDAGHVLRLLRGEVPSSDGRPALRAALARHLGARSCALTHRGIEALDRALHRLHLQPGDEVVVSTLTYPGVVGAVIRAGALPVLADTMPGHFLAGPEQLLAGVTPRTRAIVATHLFGVPCPMQELTSALASTSCCLIEDAAQGLGTLVDGRPAGSFGAMTILSFGFDKHLCAGRGGALIMRGAGLLEVGPDGADDAEGGDPGADHAVLLSLLLDHGAADRQRYGRHFPDGFFLDYLAEHPRFRATLLDWARTSETPEQFIRRGWPAWRWALACRDIRSWWRWRVAQFEGRFLGRPQKVQPDVVEPGDVFGRARAEVAWSVWSKLEATNQVRAERARAWMELLQGVSGLTVVAPPPQGVAHPLMQMVRFDDPARAQLVVRRARAAGYELALLPWRKPIHRLGRYQPRVRTAQVGLTNSETIAPRLCGLPVHAGVTDDDMKRLGRLLIEP